MDVVTLVIAIVVSAVVLLIVDRLNLGLRVGGFVNAIIAAIAIALVDWVVLKVLAALNIQVPGPTELITAVVYFVVAAVVLIIAARLIRGFAVTGFIGAVVAAVAIAVLNWVASLLNLPSIIKF
jgi:putative membrane protein